jgi:hypothetical protein
MSAKTGQRELAEVRSRLIERDLAITRVIADLRLMSGRQLEELFFVAANRESDDSSSRATRRTLAQLVDHRILVRLERQIGGVRAGSKAFVYGLGPVGHRLLERTGPRPRYREPGALFVEHTLAIAQLVVTVTTAARRGDCEVISWQGEPKCWRTFSTAGGRATLLPDLYLSLGNGAYEYRYFVEIDRNTEHLPAIVTKAQLYNRYYRSGREQSRDELFPTVLFVTTDGERARAIGRALQTTRGLTSNLFAVTTDSEALKVLLGANS